MTTVERIDSEVTLMSGARCIGVVDHGVQIIEDVVEFSRGTTLLVRGADQQLEMIQVDQTPSRTGCRDQLPPGAFPMSVRMSVVRSQDRNTMACSCLVRTSTGPSRVDIPVADGLALIQRGRHGVVVVAA